MVDVRALKAEMTLNGFTQETMARRIGISTKTFNRRLKVGVFGTDEAQKMIDILHIKKPAEIFFAKTAT